MMKNAKSAEVYWQEMEAIWPLVESIPEENDPTRLALQAAYNVAMARFYEAKGYESLYSDDQQAQRDFDAAEGIELQARRWFDEASPPPKKSLFARLMGR